MYTLWKLTVELSSLSPDFEPNVRPKLQMTEDLLQFKQTFGNSQLIITSCVSPRQVVQLFNANYSTL